MTSDTWWIIKIIAGLMFAVLGLLAAILAFLETATESKQKRIQAWFSNKWEAIDGNRWLSLPEKAIEWVLRLWHRAEKDTVHIYTDFVFKGWSKKWGQVSHYYIGLFSAREIARLTVMQCTPTWSAKNSL